MVQQKMDAFRDFAQQIAGQVVDQMCAEFEREVQTLWNDVLMYRNELDRVSKLLGMQIERENKLHGAIEQMVGFFPNVVNQTQQMTAQRPDSLQLHRLLEEHMGKHAELLNQTVAGMGQASALLQQHAANTAQWKKETLSAESEFQRIEQLLASPPVSSAMPSPLGTTKPNMPVTPRSGSVTFSSVPGSVNIRPPPGSPQSMVVPAFVPPQPGPSMVQTMPIVPGPGQHMPHPAMQSPTSPGARGSPGGFRPQMMPGMFSAPAPGRPPLPQ